MNLLPYVAAARNPYIQSFSGFFFQMMRVENTFKNYPILWHKKFWKKSTFYRWMDMYVLA